LALLPGGLATVGILNVDFSTGTLIGVGFLILILWFAYFLNQRKLPDWSLMGLGSLAYLALTAGSGLFGGLAALIVGGSGSTVVLLLFWIMILALLVKNLGGQHLPAMSWFVFGLIVICQLAVRLKYFALFGFSWSVMWQWLNVSLFSAGTLLLPLAIGICLARHYGQATVLFLIGATYLGFQTLSDNGGHVSAQVGSGLTLAFYLLLPPLFFTLLAPLCFTRARSSRIRLVGSLVLIGLALVFDILFSGLVRGDFSTLIWLSAIPYTLSLLLSFGLAFYLYEKVGDKPKIPSAY
jgi:hypothetical protein